MSEIAFRFYAELNDFLPGARRQTTFAYPLNGPQSVKHLIEALGVPHTEAALILANGEPATFAYRPQPGDRIAVYPDFTGIDIRSLPALRPPLPQPIAFLADNHLGRLARYLRLLGLDVAYGNQLSDEELAQSAQDEARVLLTRDRGLLKRRQVVFGCCLRSHDPKEQLFDVLRRYDLFRQLKPWTRCLRCNGMLQTVEKSTVLDLLESKTKLYYDEFRRCGACGQVYWQGSHFGELARLVKEVQEAHN